MGAGPEQSLSRNIVKTLPKLRAYSNRPIQATDIPYLIVLFIVVLILRFRKPLWKALKACRQAAPRRGVPEEGTLPRFIVPGIAVATEQRLPLQTPVGHALGDTSGYDLTALVPMGDVTTVPAAVVVVVEGMCPTILTFGGALASLAEARTEGAVLAALTSLIALVRAFNPHDLRTQHIPPSAKAEVIASAAVVRGAFPGAWSGQVPRNYGELLRLLQATADRDVWGNTGACNMDNHV